MQSGDREGRNAWTDGELKESLAAVWNRGAAGYDASPGHGLRDAALTHIWRSAIAEVLGDAGLQGGPVLRVLDVGTGTGIVALLAAELGHRVTAVDISKGMLSEAIRRAKELGLEVDFGLGDAESPPFEAATFDVVISRHVLWTLPRPEAAAARWAALVIPGGTVAVFDIYHPRLHLWRRAAGVLAERMSARRRRRDPGGHQYTREQRSALPLAVQRDPSCGARVLAAAGLQDIRTRRLSEVDAAERARLGPLQRLERPYLHYLAAGRRPAA